MLYRNATYHLRLSAKWLLLIAMIWGSTVSGNYLIKPARTAKQATEWRETISRKHCTYSIANYYSKDKGACFPWLNYTLNIIRLFQFGTTRYLKSILPFPVIAFLVFLLLYGSRNMIFKNRIYVYVLGCKLINPVLLFQNYPIQNKDIWQHVFKT